MSECDIPKGQKGRVPNPAANRARLGPRLEVRMQSVVEGDAVKLGVGRSKLLPGFGAVTPRQRPEDWHDIEDIVEQLVTAEITAEY